MSQNPDSADCSLVEELDLDLWEGQFEFVGSSFRPHRHDEDEDDEDDDDVITPAMVRRARSLRHADHGDVEVDIYGNPIVRSGPVVPGTNGVHKTDAQQWCEHLTDQVQMLQQQVGVLADNQTNSDERYTRAKQDNAALQARVLMLEEQLRETELRGEERLQDEQRRHRELMVRVEREKQLELENCAIRLQTVEMETSSAREEAQRMRMQSEQLRAEKVRAQEALADSESALLALREQLDEQREDARRRQAEHQQREQLVEELSAEVERLRECAQRQSMRERDADKAAQILALEAQLDHMREKERSLQEEKEELQALVLTRGIEEGRSLLTGGSSSLAAELEAMSHDENLDNAHDQSSLAKIRQALKEQQEVNAQLRTYIDGILLNIVENYPQLLEVKRSS